MKPPRVDYSRYTTSELKEVGHDLLNEYVALDEKRHGKEAVTHAYKKLGHKLGTNYGKHHFSAMTSRLEIIRAIAKLRKMIRQRGRKLEWIKEKKETTVVLAQSEMKRALAELKTKVYG